MRKLTPMNVLALADWLIIQVKFESKGHRPMLKVTWGKYSIFGYECT